MGNPIPGPSPGLNAEAQKARRARWPALCMGLDCITLHCGGGDPVPAYILAPEPGNFKGPSGKYLERKLTTPLEPTAFKNKVKLSMKEENDTERREDFDLLARFNEGSDEAFTSIVEKHSGPLINFLHRYTRDQSTSEDIAQEAFLRLYKAAGELKPGAKLSTILYKIAYHLAVDHARRSKSRAAKAPVRSLDSGLPGSREPAAGPGAEPDAICEANRQNGEIAAALAELPETQQLAIILKVYEGRSYAEIAGIMDLSFSAVESLLFRARQSLSKKIK